MGWINQMVVQPKKCVKWMDFALTKHNFLLSVVICNDKTYHQKSLQNSRSILISIYYEVD